MVCVFPNLYYEMKKHNLECEDVADILGITYHAAYRRLRGHTEWKLCEAIYLCRYFDVSNAGWLFKRCETYTTNYPKNQDGGGCHLRNL